MKRAIVVAGILLLGVMAPSFAAMGTERPLLVITRPTVVAFFAPVNTDIIDADTNEVLADFQTYTARVRKPLQSEGIDFREIYARSFRIRVGTRVRTFRLGKVYVGYYFIAPGREPRVEYGVRADDELLEIAKKYFRSSLR